MTRRFASIGRAVLTAAVVSLISVAGCKVNEESFNAKLFACNPSAVDPTCSTDEDDVPMACVPAYQLGGQNFCASSCDRTISGDDVGDGTVCMATGPTTDSAAPGAFLTRCDPGLGAQACGNPSLSCLRTDLRAADGVCMTVSPCQTNADCRDPTRATCMGEILTKTYGEKAQFQTDHTYCLQTGCNASGSSCSPGETCLRKMLSRAARPPDICVPNCDANNNCPPNYFCIPALYSRTSPAICIPGLPGFRCKNKLDCLVGDCVDSGSGFNMCSTTCGSDDDCALLDSEQETFVCDQGKGQCVGSRVFIGGVCLLDTDCRAGEICGYMSSAAKDGNCFRPCRDDGSCETFSSVPQMCLPQGRVAPPVCVPTAFANPCFLGAGLPPASADANCMGGLTCRPTGKLSICSTICLADDDCPKNRFTRDGFCQVPGNFCLPPVKDGEACDRNVQCESKSCIKKPGAVAAVPGDPIPKICDKTPGW